MHPQNTPKTRDVNDKLCQISDIRDKHTIDAIKRNQQDIRKQGNHIWRPRSLKPQCVGCRHADINIISVQHQINRYGTVEANELSVYCCLKTRIIKYPYEMCINREEKPKITMDAYIK